MTRLGAALSGILLAGCVSGDEVAVSTDGRTGARKLCLSAMLYLVRGDQFTFLSGGQQSIDGSERDRSSGGFGWRPEIEPRVKSHLDLYKHEGKAKLLWNDVAVDTFTLDEAFLLAQRVKVLAHRDPDGTLVEYHVYPQVSCGALPAALSTRAQVLALEDPSPRGAPNLRSRLAQSSSTR